jgi:hypothetical protein
VVAATGSLTFGVLGPLALWSPARPAGLGEPVPLENSVRATLPASIR